VSLVEDAVVVLKGLKVLHVVSENVVAHNDDIVLGQLRKERPTHTWRPHVADRLEVVAKLLNLIVPMRS
jgi:hypothetical protein